MADPTAASGNAEAGPSTGQDLWGSILDSVKSSRALATKNLIVLGKFAHGHTVILAA